MSRQAMMRCMVLTVALLLNGCAVLNPTRLDLDIVVKTTEPMEDILIEVRQPGGGGDMHIGPKGPLSQQYRLVRSGEMVRVPFRSIGDARVIVIVTHPKLGELESSVSIRRTEGGGQVVNSRSYSEDCRRWKLCVKGAPSGNGSELHLEFDLPIFELQLQAAAADPSFAPYSPNDEQKRKSFEQSTPQSQQLQRAQVYLTYGWKYQYYFSAVGDGFGSVERLRLVEKYVDYILKLELKYRDPKLRPGTREEIIKANCCEQ